MNKYRNKKIIIDGIQFDSKTEGKRYIELKLLQKAKVISNLELQPKFLLQPAFKKNGKTYRKIEYIADFSYYDDNKLIVEDVKGMETEVFKLKRKMFDYKYNDIELRVVR